jgi:hypothetical protein
VSALARDRRHIGHTDGVETQEAVGAAEFTRHRVRLLLPALVLVTVAYPVNELHPAAALAYAFAYVALLALGARVASVTKVRQVTATIVAGAIALLSVPWVMFPDALWLALSVYALLVAFHLLVIAAVAEQLFERPQSNGDVLAAGTSLYVLVGDMFVPAAMIVHLVTVQLTGAAAYVADAPIGWHQMVYVSFTTLTTLGRGTLQPATSAAEALAITEAVLGVLVVAVIIARLAGSDVAMSIVRRNGS